MKTNLYLFSCTLALMAALTLAGCATTMTVPVQRPAEVNLRGINKIAIGEISGNGGQVIGDLLTSKLFESGKFEVLERAQIERIFAEQKINMSGAIDEQTAAKLGKMVGAATLVLGNVSMYKSEPIKLTYNDWRDKQGGYHKTYYKTATAKVNITLKVVGLETGKLLAVKTLTEQAESKTSANDAHPEDPDKDAVLNEAVNKTVSRFMKMIAPYTDYVSTTFCTPGTFSSAPPDLKQGEDFAKAGRWEDAIQQFKSVTQSRPTDKCAWYDLGIACMYANKFQEAEHAFNEANKIAPCPECLEQINNVKRRAAEMKKLEEQGAVER